MWEIVWTSRSQPPTVHSHTYQETQPLPAPSLGPTWQDKAHWTIITVYHQEKWFKTLFHFTSCHPTTSFSVIVSSGCWVGNLSLVHSTELGQCQNHMGTVHQCLVLSKNLHSKILGWPLIKLGKASWFLAAGSWFKWERSFWFTSFLKKFSFKKCFCSAVWCRSSQRVAPLECLHDYSGMINIWR